MKHYSVQKVAKISGISIRTLHYYDQLGLLKPSVRTRAGYRLYSENELLRLQQILFYKALNIPLKEILEILDDPDFDLVNALMEHKTSIKQEIHLMNHMLQTIDKTIVKLKNKDVMKHPEELYEGLNPEKANAYRAEAITKYGTKTVEASEKQLMSMGKEAFNQLKKDFEACNATLFSMRNEDPESPEVQNKISEHYAYISQFWGTSNMAESTPEAYVGLGDLYVADERFTMVDGNAQPAFAKFMRDAMAYFAKENL